MKQIIYRTMKSLDASLRLPINTNALTRIQRTDWLEIMSEYYDMKPVVRSHTNKMIGGRRALPSETSVVGGLIDGLPCTETEGQQSLVSIWKCDSFLWRLRFLLRGEITLTVLGSRQPPVSVSVGETLSNNEH